MPHTPSGDVATQVADALVAKLCMVEVIQASENHDELMDTTSRLTGDLAEQALERFDAVLRKRLSAARRAGQLPRRTDGIPISQLVRLLREAARGLATNARPEEPWRTSVHTLTRLTLDDEHEERRRDE